jgi:hypothetical protein
MSFPSILWEIHEFSQVLRAFKDSPTLGRQTELWRCNKIWEIMVILSILDIRILRISTNYGNYPLVN